jgi:pyruvate formate lyase activating enzyme
MNPEETITGTIFNIQRYSVQDGPGIRTTVFLKGCPLRCLWCSNPESQNSFLEVAHRDSLCVGCGKCVKICTQGAIRLIADDESSRVMIDRGKCITCGKCVEGCAAEALKIYGQKMSVTEVFDEVRRDIDFYANSGGGVTASGGEPLNQPDFVRELFRRCRRIGIHTAIETCGYGSLADLERVLSETDLVLYDLKLMNSRQHIKYTKKFNKIILNNARLIGEKGVPLIIRIPFIPDINDSETNMGEMARFVSELDHERHVELLPYHRFGENKYKMLDRPYVLMGTKPPERELLERAIAIFKRYDLDCEIQA